MNSFLISIGAAIVVALLAAFVGPSFVDWNSYRDRLEAKAQQLVCRKVEITGDLDVQLLPQPVLTTGSIVISGRGDEVLTSAAGTTLSLDLGALLLGGIEVTAMELDRPVFSITTNEAGVLNWAAIEDSANAGLCAGETAGLNFRRIGVINGIANFRTAGMASPKTFDRVDATLTSGGASGPYKFTGAYGEAENRRGFSFSSGRIAAGVSSRVSGRAALDDRTEATFDGEIESWGAPLHFTGAIKLQRSEKINDQGVLRLTAEAKADIGVNEAGFSELTLTAAGPEATSTVAGAGRWDINEGIPKIGLDLRARRIDVTALLGDEETPNSQQNSVVSVLQGAKDWFESSGATGRITLGVDGAQYRGELVQDINASFNLGAGNLGIETIKAVLPGQSEFGFTGNLFEGEIADTLVGTLVFNTRDLKRLLDWAVPESHRRFTDLLPQTRGKMSLTGGVAAHTGALEMTGIEGLMDSRTFSGDLSFDLGLPGKVRGALAFDELDLDQLVPADFSLQDVLNGTAKGSAPPSAAATEAEVGTSSDHPAIDLEIEARRIKWRGRELRGVTATGGYSKRHLVVEQLNIDYLAGSQIAGDGEVHFSADGPVGSIDFQVDTTDLPALALALGADLAKIAGRGPAWLSGLRQGSFGGRLEAVNGEENWQVGMGLRGDLGGTSFTAKITTDAAPAHVASGRIEAGVKLETDNAGRLFAQIGLDALPDTTPDAAASLNFDAVGSVEKGFGYSLLFSGLEVVTSAEGSVETAPARVKGRLSLTAKDSNKIADLLGVGRSAPVLPPTGIAADFDLKGGALSVAGIAGQLAGVDVSGEGSVQISGKRSGHFDFEADHVSLPWALVSLFGADDANALVASSSSAGLPGQAAPLWSTDLIATEVLNRWPIALQVSAKTMDLGGGFGLKGAELEVNLGDGKLDLLTLSGDLTQTEGLPSQVGSGEGAEPGTEKPRLTASGQLRGTDIGLEVEGKLAANGIPLARYLKGASGKPFLTGDISGEVEFGANGRSLLSLASSLGGKGSLAISRAQLPRMDARSVIAVAERSGREARINSILSKSGARTMDLEISPVAIEAVNGRVKFGPSPLNSNAISGEMTGFLNLVAGRMDQEIVLNGENAIALGIIHAGSVGEMAREIEITGLKSGGLHWREDDVVAAQPEPAEAEAEAGLTYGDPIAAPLTSGISGSDTSGPPVGVFDQQVFELPLAEGGGT